MFRRPDTQSRDGFFARQHRLRRSVRVFHSQSDVPRVPGAASRNILHSNDAAKAAAPIDNFHVLPPPAPAEDRAIPDAARSGVGLSSAPDSPTKRLTPDRRILRRVVEQQTETAGPPEGEAAAAAATEPGWRRLSSSVDSGRGYERDIRRRLRTGVISMLLFPELPMKKDHNAVSVVEEDEEKEEEEEEEEGEERVVIEVPSTPARESCNFPVGVVSSIYAPQELDFRCRVYWIGCSAPCWERFDKKLRVGLRKFSKRCVENRFERIRRKGMGEDTGTQDRTSRGKKLRRALATNRRLGMFDSSAEDALDLRFFTRTSIDALYVTEEESGEFLGSGDETITATTTLGLDSAKTIAQVTFSEGMLSLSTRSTAMEDLSVFGSAESRWTLNFTSSESQSCLPFVNLSKCVIDDGDDLVLHFVDKRAEVRTPVMLVRLSHKNDRAKLLNFLHAIRRALVTATATEAGRTRAVSTGLEVFEILHSGRRSESIPVPFQPKPNRRRRRRAGGREPGFSRRPSSPTLARSGTSSESRSSSEEKLSAHLARREVPSVSERVMDRGPAAPWWTKSLQFWSPSDVMDWMNHVFVQDESTLKPSVTLHDRPTPGISQAPVIETEGEEEEEKRGEGTQSHDNGASLVVTLDELLKQKGVHSVFESYIMSNPQNPMQALRRAVFSKREESSAISDAPLENPDEIPTDALMQVGPDDDDDFVFVSPMACPLWTPLDDLFVLRSFRYAFEELENEGGSFKMGRFLVQEKFIERFGHVEGFDLRRLNLDLLTTKRSLWDAELLTYEILFMMVYNRSIDDFVKTMSEEFGRRRSGEGEAFSADLELVENELGIPLSRLDYSVFGKFHLYRLQRDLELKEIERDDLVKEISQLSVELVHRQSVSSTTEDDSPSSASADPRVVQLIAQKQEELRRLDGQYLDALMEHCGDADFMTEHFDAPMSRIREEIEELKKQKVVDPRIAELRHAVSITSERLREIEIEIDQLRRDREYAESSGDEIRRRYESSSTSWGTVVDALITMQLERLLHKDRLYILPVKLALSRLSEHRPSNWMAKGAKLLGLLFDPKCLSFGILHASILIENVQLHWFSNALVKVKHVQEHDNYDDVMVFDLDAPLVCSRENVWKKVSEIAKMIVRWNTKSGYSSFSPFVDHFRSLRQAVKKRRPGSRAEQERPCRNCQEFCHKIIQLLGCPPPYPEVGRSITVLKLAAFEALREDQMQWRKFEFSSTFFDLFEGAFQKTFPAATRGSGSVFFQSHGQLDLFFKTLREIEPYFVLMFPGDFAVLKSYDRAFWIMQKKHPEGRVAMYQPLHPRCPFNEK